MPEWSILGKPRLKGLTFYDCTLTVWLHALATRKKFSRPSRGRLKKAFKLMQPSVPGPNKSLPKPQPKVLPKTHAWCFAHLLSNHRNFLDKHTLKLIYLAQIQSHLNYGLILWGNKASCESLNKIKILQNKCIQKTRTEKNPVFSGTKKDYMATMRTQ